MRIVLVIFVYHLVSSEKVFEYNTTTFSLISEDYATTIIPYYTDYIDNIWDE